MDQKPLYSADRRGFYSSGKLVLHKNNPLKNPEPMLGSDRGDFESTDIMRHVLHMFPEGLSLHGWSYVSRHHPPRRSCDDTIWLVDSGPTIELVFEYVRRAAFPHRPSRLQSYFAFDDLERVRKFSNSAVYEVTSNTTFRADQTWLNVAWQFAVASYNAHQYWSGAASGTPDWEYLLVPEVTTKPV